jgi:glucose 1-dehydrogenase
VNYLSHPDDAEAVAERVRALGRRAVTCRADISDRGQVETMIRGVVAEFGHLDILVSNAYQSIRESFLDTSEVGMRTTFATTYFGAFYCCQTSARQMVAQGTGGSIIVISSVQAEHPFPMSMAYNSCKAGLIAMAQTAAVELAPHRIRVNVINPGWIDTPGERRYYAEDTLRRAGQGIPWGRLGEPIDIGRCAAYLASDDADYVTGAVFRVDGGIILGLKEPD